MSSSLPLDISRLSESQQTALQTYTSVTDQEPIAAIPLLQRSEWNVQIAITRFFEGEPTVDPVAEARAALPPPSSRQTTNLQLDDLLAGARAPPTERQDPNLVCRISTQPGDGISYRPSFVLFLVFTPFYILYRVAKRVLSPLGILFPFLPRAFARLAQITAPRPSRRSLAPADNAGRFIREFTEEYGVNDLPFVENGFNLALDNAEKELKFLLVVLLSPSHDDVDSWVRETLLSAQMTSFVQSQREKIIMWGGSVQDAEGYQVADAVKCRKFPFLGIVCRTPDSGAAGMSVVMRAVGPMPPSELIAKLGSAMTAQEGHLASARLVKREAQASRSLRQEQDSAYERSLAQDRERARLKREQATTQARMEKEALERQETQERNARQWTQWRAQSIAPEPDMSAKDTVRISIRLPSGERIIRGFRPEADLEEIYAFVECRAAMLQADGDPKEVTILSEKDAPQEPAGFEHAYGFRLVSPMPRKRYAVEDGGTIAERVGRGANLIVEPIDDNDVDE
jgi:FAS-associated factor 2